MKKILLTGATDGIGLETARTLASLGHHMLLHGRNPEKLAGTAKTLEALPGAGPVESFVADLADLTQVEAMARAVAAAHDHLDVLINNAGVFRLAEPRTGAGLDARFVVNTLAPYLLTRLLLPRFGPASRVVNLSSAAQAPVDLEALTGSPRLPDGAAYAQSKLALTMWSSGLARSLGDQGPVVVAANPGSFLGTRMVREAYGRAGADVGIGAEILRQAALDEGFADASGRYFDNDSGRFAAPHPDGVDPARCEAVVRAMDTYLAGTLNLEVAP